MIPFVSTCLPVSHVRKSWTCTRTSHLLRDVLRRKKGVIATTLRFTCIRPSNLQVTYGNCCCTMMMFDRVNSWRNYYALLHSFGVVGDGSDDRFAWIRTGTMSLNDMRDLGIKLRVRPRDYRAEAALLHVEKTRHPLHSDDTYHCIFIRLHEDRLDGYLQDVRNVPMDR